MIFISNYKISMWLKGLHFGINRGTYRKHVSGNWNINVWGSSNFTSDRKTNSCCWKKSAGWRSTWR